MRREGATRVRLSAPTLVPRRNRFQVHREGATSREFSGIAENAGRNEIQVHREDATSLVIPVFRRRSRVATSFECIVKMQLVNQYLLHEECRVTTRFECVVKAQLHGVNLAYTPRLS